MWTIYSLVVRKLNGEYSTLFITRKIFFYGTLTSIPALFIEAGGSLAKVADIPWQNFAEPVVTLNFLCLTVFSSLFGYLVWNKVMKQIGTVLASNYLYAIPLVTIITAVIFEAEVQEERILRRLDGTEVTHELGSRLRDESALAESLRVGKAVIARIRFGKALESVRELTSTPFCFKTASILFTSIEKSVSDTRKKNFSNCGASSSLYA